MEAVPGEVKWQTTHINRATTPGPWFDRCQRKHEYVLQKRDGRYYISNGPHLILVTTDKKEAIDAISPNVPG